MRVAVVCPVGFGVDGYVGGGTRYPLEYASALAAHVPCDFYAFGAEDREHVDGHGLRHVVLRASPQPDPDAFSARLLARLGGYDVVHFHTLNKMAVAGALRCRLPGGAAAFLTPLGGGGRAGVGRGLHRAFRGFPLISDYTRVQHGWLEGRPRAVIHGGGDARGFDPPAGRPEPTRVVCAGRISAHKGIDVLIEALPAGAELVVCGQVLDDDYARHLRRLAAGRAVEFMAPAGDRQLGQLYSSAAVVVLPSLHRDFRGQVHVHPELLGLVLLEGMWHSAPCVTTAVGGAPEVVEDGVTGLVVAPGDVGGMRTALTTLLEDEGLRRRMGRAGRQAAEGRFTWDLTARRGLDFYRSVLSGAPPARRAPPAPPAER